MLIQPYLFFEGRADEAIEFYKKTLGAKVEMAMRFKDAPDQSMISPGSADKVMHAAIKIGDAVVLISDGRNTGKPNFQGFSLTLYPKDEAEADKLFGALSAGRRSANADGQDILRQALRHGRRQIRRRLDDHRSRGSSCGGRVAAKGETHSKWSIRRLSNAALHCRVISGTHAFTVPRRASVSRFRPHGIAYDRFRAAPVRVGRTRRRDLLVAAMLLPTSCGTRDDR